jgi:hypothetical protein
MKGLESAAEAGFPNWTVVFCSVLSDYWNRRRGGRTSMTSLFDPLDVGDLTLKNRVILAP